MLKIFQSRQSLQMETHSKQFFRRHTFAYSGQKNDEVNDNQDVRRQKTRKVVNALSRIDENEPVQDIIHNYLESLPNQNLESAVNEELNTNRYLYYLFKFLSFEFIILEI